MHQHFIFIKGDAYLKNGSLISAFEATKLLLNSRIWPLYSSTSNRKSIKQGDLLLFYISGKHENSQRVIAKSCIKAIEPWTKKHDTQCPIYPELAFSAVILGNVKYFSTPVTIKDHIDHLSFFPENRIKWGTALMGGVRRITAEDYDYLTDLD